MKYSFMRIEDHPIHNRNRKQKLSLEEKAKLGFVLADFIQECENLSFAKATINLDEHLRYKDDRVYIRNGINNPYTFYGNAIDSIWMMKPDTIVLECREIGEIEDVGSINIYNYSKVLFILYEETKVGYGICEKCGAELIPGQNYYTMKLDRICCDCSGHAVYPTKPTNGPISYYGCIGQSDIFEPDYEEEILDREQDWRSL